MGEWEIENFSCWSHGIHDKCTYNHLNSNSDILLYPKGGRGTGEFLEVHYYDHVNNALCEMSFIGSDGYVIYTCTPTQSWHNRFHTMQETITGPKFEEVVARIRSKEPWYKDRLILRWKTERGYRIERFRTVIDASSAVFQIKSEMLDSNDWKIISNTSFASLDENEQVISVSAVKTDSTIHGAKVKFKLEANDEFFVQASIWMIQGLSDISRRHDHDCVFTTKRSVILPFEVPLRDFQEFKAIMHLKISTGRLEPYCTVITALLPVSYHVKMTHTSIPSEMKSVGIQSIVDSDATRESISSSIPLESQSENAVTALTRDFMSLYQDHDFSDVELRCGTVSFPTHKNILSARSPVFKAMLLGDMKEAACGHVDVEDLDPHTLGRFLSYLYSGATGEEALQWEEASKLFYAADKYQVPSLKEDCSAVLRSSVTLENVCHILSLADRHQDEDLRSVAFNFITNNYSEVLRSQNWEKFMSSDPVLAVKTVTSIAKMKNVKISDSVTN